MVDCSSVSHFLSFEDMSKGSLASVLSLAEDLKAGSLEHRTRLESKNIGFFSTKSSLRTRVSFEIAVNGLGGNFINIRNDEIHLGEREEPRDVMRVLTRYLDAFIVRSNDQEQLVQMSQYSTIPLINALTDLEHPCQALADLLTLREVFGKLDGIRLAYIGDGNNVVHSLLLGASLAGIELTVITPPGHEPDNIYLDKALSLSAENGGPMPVLCNDPELVIQADVIYTDVWESMGQTVGDSDAVTRTFLPYQVNESLLQGKDIPVLHCLPAYRGKEITNDVLEKNSALIFQQAENRLHVQKALLVSLFS